MRTGYCKAAKRWVASYDHFCPFLNTPIGERNHARFWWFLFSQANTLSWAIAVVHSGFISHSWNHGEWMRINGHAFATVFILYCMMLFVAPLFLFHSFLAVANMRTREFMRAEEVSLETRGCAPTRSHLHPSPYKHLLIPIPSCDPRSPLCPASDIAACPPPSAA